MNKKLISQSELNDVIKKHNLYCCSGKGQRAELTNLDLRGLDFSDKNLTNIDFSHSILSECNFENSILNRSSFYYSTLRNTNFHRIQACESNFRKSFAEGAIFSESDLTAANLSKADFERASFYGCNLTSINILHSDVSGTNLKNAILCAPTAMLLADWGELSDELTALAMAFDASCHQDKELFDNWSEWGPCPYGETNYQRACNFLEKRSLWHSSIAPPTPYNLMIMLIKEKCADSDWHEQAPK